jgi:hypothetical protein
MKAAPIFNLAIMKYEPFPTLSAYFSVTRSATIWNIYYMDVIIMSIKNQEFTRKRTLASKPAFKGSIFQIL